MAIYYAVQRSGSTLAHYGVKGMKWGIRKAVEKAYLERPHSQKYNHIKDKLAYIQQRKIDRAINKVQKAQVHGRVRKVKRLYNKANEKMQELNKNADRNYQRGQHDQAKEDRERTFWWSDNSSYFNPIPNLTKNLEARSLMIHDNRKSRKLISDKGHKEAVRKRNQYAKQMAKMFSGTAYARQTKAEARKRIRYQR